MTQNTFKAQKDWQKKKYGNGSRSCGTDMCIMIDPNWTFVIRMQD